MWQVRSCASISRSRALSYKSCGEGVEGRRSEPTDYQVTATDSEPDLQSAGYVGLQGYLSGSATTVPVTMSVDNFEVRRAERLRGAGHSPVARVRPMRVEEAGQNSVPSSSVHEQIESFYEWIASRALPTVTIAVATYRRADRHRPLP